MRRLLLLPLLALALAGCGVPHFGSGGFAQGDGQITLIKPADRGGPIAMTGTTLEGKPFDLASTRGKVTVVNLWGAWCGDCIKEAGDIEAAHRQLGASVPFVGIDAGDHAKATPLSFQRGNHLTYPSVYTPDGSVLLDFDEGFSLDTVPATVILDKQGRIATVIRGMVPDTRTLVEAVQDVENGTHGA